MHIIPLAYADLIRSLCVYTLEAKEITTKAVCRLTHAIY